MYDKNSDYAHNKRADAIVYISATGSPVMLTHADFASEKEFLQWKLWSDSDYKTTEQNGRGFYDNCISLDESLNCIGAVASIEDEFFSKLDEPERIRARVDLSRHIRDALNEKQYRRLWLYYVDGLNLEAIALTEGIAHQNISKTITRAKKKLGKLLRK